MIFNKNAFRVSKTYSTVSPESAERGDFCDSGYVYENKACSLHEVLELVADHGCFDNFQDNGIYQDLYQIEREIDYSNAHETSECLHISGPRRAMKILNKYIKAKFHKH